MTALVKRIVLRARGGGRQRNGRRRDGVVGAVVLADAKDIEADLVGQLDLLEEVAQPLCRADFQADVGESVEAKFHSRFLSDRVRCGRTSGDGLSDRRRRRSR